MKYNLIISLLFFTLSLFAQQKGVNPISDTKNDQSGETYAVVVGISDYQDPGIPDLRFADKDAEAFAGFLQSPAGGGLDEDHLKLLTNEGATVAQFAIALDWLVEVTGEGDRAIIYFSGHGDVEKKTFSQPGFLLCWDAPSRVYLSGGTFPIPMFKLLVSTLSIEKKARVLVITDACRAGKLAGNTIEGSKLTTNNLSQQFANEIKILSCQPDEYSIEGEQWGGGRGAFSYHLLDGLYGMADRNNDQSVNLMEVRSYLEQKVSEEVAPESQLPMTVGNGKENLADVFPEILEQIKEGRKRQMQLFDRTDQRGIEDEVLASVDESIRDQYRAFKQALRDKWFLSPAGDCADDYYEQLIREPELEPLHSSLRRNFAAALQDDAQQVMKRLLESDPGENAKTLFAINKEYAQYPANIRRAAELLGQDHYMYNTLLARSYWFEGFIKDQSSCACRNITNAREVLPYYQKALEYQPNMPHAWSQMAALHGIQRRDVDSAEYYARLAIDAVPGWLLVYHWMSNIYLNNYADSKQRKLLEKASWWLEAGLKADSNSIVMLNELAYLRNLQGKFREEQAVLDRSLQIDSLARTMHYKGEGYLTWGKYEEAEKAFLQAVRMDTFLLFNQDGLLKLYSQTYQHEKVRFLLKKVVRADWASPADFARYIKKLNFQFFATEGLELAQKVLESTPDDHWALTQAGICYSVLDQYDEAEKMYVKAIDISPTNLWTHANLGLNYLKMRQFSKAERSFTTIKNNEGDEDADKCMAPLYLYFAETGNNQEALAVLRKGMSFSAKTFLYRLDWISRHYRLEHASDHFKDIEKLYPAEYLVNYYHAQYLTLYKKDLAAAFWELEKACQKTPYWDMSMKYFFLLTKDKERWDRLRNECFSNYGD